MSVSLTLLSSSRRGAAALTGALGLDGRRLVTAALQLGGHQGETILHQQLPAASVAVSGPAHCDGVNPAIIVRRYPVAGDVRQEPNFLAAIEFDHADLPWLFSGPPQDNHLDPWLMLVVVPTGGPEPAGRVKPGPRGPILQVFDRQILPAPAQAWAFAHIQVSGEPDPVAAVTNNPQAPAVRSRIVCPTHLRADTHYTAALVPTFELGRLAGIGHDIPNNPDDPFWSEGEGQRATARKQYPLWTPQLEEPIEHFIELPAYDHWTFTTGPAGDFETLARKLRRVRSSHALGLRRVAVQARASLMQEDPEDAEPAHRLFAPSVEEVPTAFAKINDLAPGPLAPDQPDPPAQATALHDRLKVLIDLVAGASDECPVVGPPLYGQWAADASSLDLTATDHWVTQLNADPYQRIAAGVGARIVAHDQEALMANAWRQLAELDNANRRIRMATMMAATMQILHAKLAKAPQDVQLRVTSGCFGRVTAHAGRTVRAQVELTTLPVEVLGPGMVRVAARARRAARMSSAIAKLDDSAASPVTLSGAVMTAFVAGSPAVMPSRWTSAPVPDLDAIRQVLDAPVFTTRRSELLATVDALHNLDTISENIAARFGEPDDDDVSTDEDVRVVFSPEVSAEIRTAPWFAKLSPGLFKRLKPAKPAGVPLGAAMKEAQVKPIPQAEQPVHLKLGKWAKVLKPGVGKAAKEVGPLLGKLPKGVIKHVQDEAKAAEDAPPIVNLRAHDFAKLKRAARGEAAGAEILKTALTLQSNHTHLSLGPALRAAPNTLLPAMIDDHATAAAVGVAEAMRATLLAEVGIEYSSALSRLGRLSDRDVAAFRAAADARFHDRPAAQTLPNFVKFDATAAATVLTALAPEHAYGDMLNYAHRIVSPRVIPVGLTRFRLLRAAPTFSVPLSSRLAVVDKEWLLGGVSGLPPNSVSLFGINERFVEALLAGANHEMARELVWRGYPTNLRGTSFRRFFDLPGPDVKPMSRWTSLGENSDGPNHPKAMTVVVIKADLLRRYPSTIISAVRGTPSDGGFTVLKELPEIDQNHIGEDVTYSILQIAPQVLREEPAGPASPRWYISLRENTDEARFGLDDRPEKPSPNAAKEDSADWTWQGLPHPAVAHLTAEALGSPLKLGAATTSAQVGSRLFQQPFRLFLRATEYIAE